jgi:hypothetical protein
MKFLHIYDITNYYVKLIKTKVDTHRMHYLITTIVYMNLSDFINQLIR